MPPFGESEPIGILDSGVGGLSVLRHVQVLLPEENLLYFADQAHVPYGTRPDGEVLRFVEGITRFLLARRSKLIVVACNRASAAALGHLRETFSHVPFVGMEPAVKPGTVQTSRGRIGVLATRGTFNSQRYANLMARYAQGVAVYEDPCVGLVERIEAGDIDTPETEKILCDALDPMLAAEVDTIVLGCTHYPFVLPLIRRLAGPAVTVIDPAPAVARQTKRVLQSRGLLAQRPDGGDVWAYTSGNAEWMATQAQQLLGQSLDVSPVAWDANGLLQCP